MYKSKTISIFNSLSEADEYWAIKAAEQNPVDRIKETVQLILKVYPLKDRKPNTNKIYFDSI